MNTAEIKEKIRQSALQHGKDVSDGRSLVAVSNQSGYNVSSYADYAHAEAHAKAAAAAFEGLQETPQIYLMVIDPRIGIRQVVDGELKLIE